MSPTRTGIRVAAVGDIADGEALTLPPATTGHSDTIAVFRDGGEYFALDDTCSHGQASLSEGWVENGEVECPLHSARFCLQTGAALCMPATVAQRAHRVEVRDSAVWVYPGEEAVR